MSDTSTVIVNGKTILLYNDRNIDCLLFDEIYDPDNPTSGNIFPTLYSRVMKTDGSLWYVSARDETRYAVTLSPCRIVTTDDTEARYISFGNDEFVLYVDKRVNPALLVLDAKLLFFGNNLVEYLLTKDDGNGNTISVSRYYDSTGTYVSDRVPMTALSASELNKRFPTNCHTHLDLNEGDNVYLSVYNNLGNKVAEVNLTVRETGILNDLNSQSIPITDMQVSSVQRMSGDNIYVYTKQDIEHLNLLVTLHYADGTTREVNIDNKKCFIYGLEDYIPAYPGFSQPIIVKYFLGSTEDSTIATNKGSQRFIAKQFNLITLVKENTFSLKLSVIPVFDYNNLKWTLKYFAYTTDRSHCYDVTQYVTYNTSFIGDSTKWGTEQYVEVKYDLQEALGASTEVTGVQSFYITVWNPTKYQQYTLREDSDASATVYGADSSIYRRPTVRYDALLDQFFIPTSIFGNWEAMVESFYTLAKPPYNRLTETIAPTPTHFTIRDASTANVIIANPVKADTYSQAISKTYNATTKPNDTVVVEFLREMADGTYEILYGVPVTVTAGYYNTLNN